MPTPISAHDELPNTVAISPSISIARHRLNVIDNYEDLVTFSPDLDALHDTAGSANPFTHSSFFLPWVKQATQDNFSIKCQLVWSGSDLVGFMPLFEKKMAPRFLNSLRLSPPLRGTTPPMDILCAHNSEETVAEFASRIDKEKWDLQYFPSFLENSQVATRWAALHKEKGHRIETEAVPDYCAIDVFQDWETYYSQRSKKTRRNIRWLDNNFVGEFSVFKPGDDNLEYHLKIMQDVIEKSWKANGEMLKSGLQDLRDLAFSLSQSNRLRMITLSHEDNGLSYLLEIDDGQHRHAFHNAYNADYQKLAPGKQVIQKAIKSVFADQRKTYNFWGNRDYFSSLANTNHSACNIKILRQGAMPDFRRKLGLFARKAIGKG